MAKFNEKTKSEKLTTYEGGKAYAKEPATDWLNFLFSSFLEDAYYESSEQQMERFIDLTNKMGQMYGCDFVAKAANMARNEFGLRSVSQLTAAILNSQNWESKRQFFRDFCHRPDDVSEIFGAIDMLGEKRSHALVRGCGDYLSTLGEYQIDKYKMNGKKYNMFDIINITHAKSAAIGAYKNGTIESADTWEKAISSTDDKFAEWTRLVAEHKLGYLALIRNLRNILNGSHSSEWIRTALVPQLVDEKAIKKSMVYPYQIYCAYKNMDSSNPYVVMALDEAFRIACGNVEKLDGSSMIILDVSGSMDDTISNKSNITLKQVGACYAAMLYVSQDAEFVKFGNSAKKKSFKKTDSIFTIIKQMTSNDDCGYGTEIDKAFGVLDKHYDRLFIISDFQVMEPRSSWWSYYNDGTKNFAEYCDKYGDSRCYSFDLGNYNNTQTDPTDNRVSYCTALNDNVFKMIPFLEGDKNLVDFVNQF